MSTEEEEINPYELLGVGLESTEAEIKRAYHKRSLKVHPDKFHELNQAYELLLDPLRRIVVDAKVRAKEARKAQFAKFDAKRKNMVDVLEESERASKKSRVEKGAKQKEMWRENERIMEEGRILREEREKELKKREQEMEIAERKAQEKDNDELEPPSLGALDTTVRLKYPLSSQPTLTTAESLSALLAPFGLVESFNIVLSLKPAPPKKAKRGIALVPFKQVGDAFAAVCASKRAERAMRDVEVSWAQGKEPELIAWLKKMGKLGGTTVESSGNASKTPSNASVLSQPPASSAPPTSAFSSFPSVLPGGSEIPSANPSTGITGLDYESLTLMRLRQAERARLEREILEREAQES
ncbi:hypothetical protein PHLCEN_2v13355 [Hermanssonia centrifuga]|uniref:J domain-containing protein n=1 Tax=Hermanssonia centrifuga TaxID=98765 RepID=A0A2R6NEE5_9APHY|nr:hypothetical protein PHLCEN_2v13355 [Hermanssonia centrifuga]